MLHYLSASVAHSLAPRSFSLAVNALAFDVNAACSGFLFALNTADAYLRTGLAKNALIIGSEVLSKLVDWTDRVSCIRFGDGAGAVGEEE